MSISADAINLPEVVAEVTALFARYELALVENDIAVLNELFWDAPDTLRYGPTENLYGYGEIKGFRTARPSVGLERRLIKNVITTFGRNYATANCEFERGGKLGRQSQTWVRMPDGWRITAAHISMIERPGFDAASSPRVP